MDHDQHCFVAMAWGDTQTEHDELQGWYGEVIKPAIVDCGFEPRLAFEEQGSHRITDDVREHLAHDGMAIFDLGGVPSNKPPNPNVMYELGIRHAFDLPSIILAHREQDIPFDVAETRVIWEQRHFGTMQLHREKLKGFIQAAKSGDFFKPMATVRRAELLASASPSDSVAAEVREIKQIVMRLSEAQQVSNRTRGSALLGEALANFFSTDRLSSRNQSLEEAAAEFRNTPWTLAGFPTDAPVVGKKETK
jgi:hypothetical protein